MEYRHSKEPNTRFGNAIPVSGVKLNRGSRYVLLPCQWKYWHRAKNRLRDKTGFGMYNPQNVEKSGFGQSVCVSVCLAVCLAVAFPANSQGPKG